MWFNKQSVVIFWVNWHNILLIWWFTWQWTNCFGIIFFPRRTKKIFFLTLMRNSCHIRHLMKCPNWCRTWNICFLLIFSWKMLQPNFAFWDILLLLRCLNSKGIKLQRSIRVICIIFDLIFFQLKIKNITNIPSSTTISTLCQASNMTWIAHKSLNILENLWKRNYFSLSIRWTAHISRKSGHAKTISDIIIDYDNFVSSLTHKTDQE